MSYLERRDKAHTVLMQGLLDDYRADRKQMSEIFVKVEISLERLANRVDRFDGSREQKP